MADEAAGFAEPDDPGPWSRILTPDPHAECRAEIGRLTARAADDAALITRLMEALADRDARIAVLTKEDT